MKIQLPFTEFIDLLQADRTIRGLKPQVFYLENELAFKVHFKTWDSWFVCSTIKKKELPGLTSEQAISEFRSNFLSGAVVASKDDDGFTATTIKPVVEEVTAPQSPYGITGFSFSKNNDVREEATTYESFYLGIVKGWEAKVIKALMDNTLQNKQAGFGDFIKQLFNTINTEPFKKRLRGIIRRTMVSGLESAEEETNVQVGIQETFRNKLAALEDQQLNGYTANGKRWHGIKGATRDLQMDILKSIEEDVKNKATRGEMVKHVQEIFETSTKSQAERIARTETTRFVNEGKMAGYKDSQLGGNKAYAAVMDGKTSDICRRLHKKYFDKGIELDEEFRDDVTGITMSHPPAHPNCRCVIEYRA